MEKPRIRCSLCGHIWQKRYIEYFMDRWVDILCSTYCPKCGSYLGKRKRYDKKWRKKATPYVQMRDNCLNSIASDDANFFYETKVSDQELRDLKEITGLDFCFHIERAYVCSYDLGFLIITVREGR